MYALGWGIQTKVGLYAIWVPTKANKFHLETACVQRADESHTSSVNVCLLFASFCFLGDQYALKMRLVDHVYDDQVIDYMTMKIILPEGAR